MIGRTLAHYRITSRLGAGGMGEVYQATDTKLDRSVAIKILPEVFASDAERVARFAREARVLAALNHPNIAAIYGLEEADGGHFLVLELVEGETLAERLKRGAMHPVDALQIARQIAEALEAAHDKSVIHRDIKPANVKLTPDGKVKVLDFGLAKAFASDPVSALSNSPTMSIAATDAGIILGTAPYMSPEQAKGTVQVDKRTDLFSLGCVLYEMLTGRQPFQGDSLTEVLAGVLAREPDLTLLPVNLNPRIPALIRRCLQKDPKKRWQGAGDLRVEIESILPDPNGLELRSEARPQSVWRTAVFAAACLVVGALIGGIGVLRFRTTTPAKPVRFSFELPEGQIFTRTGRPFIAFAPGGESIVYVQNQQLFMRPMNEATAHAIPGTLLDVSTPFFSPDGQWIAFYSFMDNTIKRIAITGGAPVTICASDPPTGASWTGHRIVFGQGGKGIYEVPDAGGTPKVLVPVDKNEYADAPEVLPDDKTILFTLAKGNGNDRFDKAQIVLAEPGSKDKKVLIDGGSAGHYLPSGHVVYALGPNLLAAPVDLKRSTAGGAVPILESVLRSGSGMAAFAVSNSGGLAYVQSNAGEGTRSLAIAERTGTTRNLALPPGSYDHPRVSPDGKQIVVQTSAEGGTLWIYDLAGTTSIRRLTFGGGSSVPIWSGDGKYVTFQSTRDGKAGLFRQLADGTGAAERLTSVDSNEQEHRPRSWLKDGRTLVFSILRNNDWGIWTIAVPASQKPTVLEDLVGSTQGQPGFSPDGQWLAYESDESGTRYIYVVAYPKTDARKYQISKEPSDFPQWSPDGKELFYYQSVNNKLVSVAIQTRPTFSFGEPVAIPIDMSVQGQTQQYRRYDVMPDGKRFLVLTTNAPLGTRSSPQVRVILNWIEELKQRVPSI